MTITNNTQDQNIYYSISCTGSVDCGSLTPGNDKVLVHYDNKTDVKLTLNISKTEDETVVIIEQSGL